MATVKQNSQAKNQSVTLAIAGESQLEISFKKRRPWWVGLFRNPTALIGLVIIMVVISLAIFAPLLTPYDPSRVRLVDAKQPPFSPGHLLGTDYSGRDVWANLVYGARIPVIVGSFSVLVSGSLGVVLGLFSGFYKGRLDDIITWVSNVMLSFPPILLIISVVAAIGQSNLLSLIIVLSLTSWVIYARIIRSETLILREKEFIESARAIGVRDRTILLKHILPNLINSLIVIATFEVARIIITEAALSYLGLGVERTTASWGKFLADNKDKLTVAWWLPIIPGIAISLTVLAINLLGDWLREELDPRFKV